MRAPYEPYYAQGPLIQLDQNVCIVGHRGARADRVVRYLGASLGLRYSILDELVAHSVGQDAHRFIAASGLSAYRAIERDVLRRLVDEQPYGLIAAASDALSGFSASWQIRRRIKTVWLDMSLGRLVAGARKDPRIYPGLPLDVTEDAMQAYLDDTWGGRGADVRIEMSEGDESVTAKALIERMGWG
ncbi:MAG: shikimate kinase [Myxococcota bacterium]|nr:shikimate kinase [Myxococcota bacterium]